MSLFNEQLLREIIAEEVRRGLREELAELSRRGGRPEYLPVAEVAVVTIRTWMALGRLGRYRAGREDFGPLPEPRRPARAARRDTAHA
jgi:hypothetical protein